MIMLEEVNSNNGKVATAIAGIVAHLRDILPDVNESCVIVSDRIKSKLVPITRLDSAIASEIMIRNNPSLAPRKLGKIFCILRADKSHWRAVNHSTVLTAATGEVYVREKKLVQRAPFPFMVHPHLYKSMEELIIDAPSKILNALVGDGPQTFADYFKLFEETAKAQGCQLFASYCEEDSIDDFGFNWKRKSFRFFLSDRQPSEVGKGSPAFGMSFTITIEVK